LATILVFVISTTFSGTPALFGGGSASSGAGVDAAREAFSSHIDHIVLVILENHAFDNYFGTYCTTVGKYCSSTSNGIPNGTCVPLNPAKPQSGCVRPFPFTPANWTLNASSAPLSHSWDTSHAAWNNGAMNGFYAAEKSGDTPFGYYNGTTAPLYWDLAEEYSLDDDFFSSVLSYSLPNHWHFVAGQAPQVSLQNKTEPTPGQPVNVSREHLYLNESNQTRSVEDLLENSSVSWDYYDYSLGNYSQAIQVTPTSAGRAYSYWNPQAAKAESYTAALTTHFVSNTQYYSDARNGTLPSLSWVIPPGQDSDHPPDNSTLAQAWLASIVDAAESSPDWNTTALFVVWDDYGGFYDHVDPPATSSGQQLGFRVPMILVSPYARKNYVSDSFGYFESLLHLMEWRFQLGCITALDCTAPLPLSMFNFHQPPRPPLLFPTNFTAMHYPMSLRSARAPIVPYYPPTEFTYFPDGEAPDID
jgi:phospholipase C